MNRFTVFGHVLANRLPVHAITIGDAWIKYLPEGHRTGGGPQMQHATSQPRANYVSTIPAHMLIESNWQIGFKGIVSTDSDAAIEIVRKTKIPQFQAAYHFATGDTANVVVSGFVNEKTQEEFPVWSYTALYNPVTPNDLSRNESARAEEVAAILQQDSSASRAARLLSQAEWRLAASGGIVAFQAATVLDAALAIEKITQEVNKKAPAEPRNAAQDSKVQSRLSRLKIAIESNSSIEVQLGVIKKLSQRASEVERMGTVAILEHSADTLGLCNRDITLAKRLWNLRSTKLAHPGKLPEDLTVEASSAVALGRRFLDAYLVFLLDDDGTADAAR